MKIRDYPEGERGAFNPDALLSPTLPSRYYHDPAIYRRELRGIFHKSWCYVGHAGQLPEPGDYRVERVADQCIFLLRGEDSEIRAFFNVCQHRGHELLDGQGSCRKRIVCPYHAWSYSLDGRLIQAPHTEQLQGFDPADFALRPVRLANCAGLLFANLDNDAAEFAQEYPGLQETLSESLPTIDSFGTAFQFDYDIAANWKIVVDNFSEGYHIPVAHRKLTQVLDSGSGRCARQERRYAFFESRSKAGYEGLELEPGSPYRSWTLWPNTCMLSLPGCENLVVIRMAANGPDRCREHVDLLAANGEVTPTLEALKGLFADQFNSEDIAIVESVHRGLKSLAYDQGRYVVDQKDGWYSESGLHRFHRSILEALDE
ncbi:MAG: aromatic ring-hydroxylating dioxygenase subunit alpha [Gammaproteobacteria bacterium]|nr:aromatic ring-hydroxylating dioxygenase subunit alpha [Gammaproteobacteria bacterium]